MNRRLIPAFLLLFGASGCGLVDGGSGLSQDELKPNQILEKVLAAQALGPGAADGPTRDLVAKATITEQAGDQRHITEYELAMLWPASWRVTLGDAEGGLRTFVGDQHRSQEIQGGKVVRDDVPEAELGKERFLRLLLLPSWFRYGEGKLPEMVGVMKQDGEISAVTLSKVDADGRPWILSLDAMTLRPQSVEGWEHGPDGKMQQTTTQFGGYDESLAAGGYPKLLTTYAAGKLLRETRINRLSWNRGLTERDFRAR